MNEVNASTLFKKLAAASVVLVIGAFEQTYLKTKVAGLESNQMTPNLGIRISILLWILWTICWTKSWIL